jgi:hypothetical protein
LHIISASSFFFLHTSKFIYLHCLLFYQVHESLQRIRERKLVNFIEWGPASIQVFSYSTMNKTFFFIPFTLFLF